MDALQNFEQALKIKTDASRFKCKADSLLTVEQYLDNIRIIKEIRSQILLFCRIGNGFQDAFIKYQLSKL